MDFRPPFDPNLAPFRARFDSILAPLLAPLRGAILSENTRKPNVFTVLELQKGLLLEHFSTPFWLHFADLNETLREARR